MSIIKCTRRNIVDAPQQQPTRPRPVAVIKAASINTRSGVPPVLVEKPSRTHSRKSAIDKIRDSLLDGLDLTRWRAKREAENFHVLGKLVRSI